MNKIKFFKILNMMLARYALRNGLRTAYWKSLYIYQEVDDLINGGRDDEAKLIALQQQFKSALSRRGETTKARGRRLREGWFEQFAPEDRPGIDIGCQFDPINETFRRWDLLFGDGDAALMEGIPDRVFHTVYCSHVLEHMVEPIIALRNWYRIVRPGGHLIILVPHRDLYEKKTTLPSNWNPDHKWFWLPDRAEEPHTLSLEGVIREAKLHGSEVVSQRVLDEGYDHSLPADVHAVGEYSIEVIIQKRES